MDTQNKTMITVESTINAPVAKVWDMWTQPEHIMQWNNASDDWHTPASQNDLRAGGKFSSTMAAKDGSMSFDFGGVHDIVKQHEQIASTLGDGRTMNVNFIAQGDTTRIIESFEPETQNSHELQRGGWQAILNNFKKYVEAQ